MDAIVLVGLPGVGKSTVGRALGERLGMPFVDLDDEIAAFTGLTPGDFIRTRGEDAFRACEVECLTRCLAHDGVIATGGGVVTSAGARELLRDHRVIWLTMDTGALVSRVRGGDRPLLGDDPATSLATLAEARSALYAEVADASVNANAPLDVVVRDIIDVMEKWVACE